MAAFKFVALLLLLSSVSAFAFDWTPFNENICDEVECGKGTCVSNSSSLFDFSCECDAGWKRTRLGDEDEEDLKYLPCIIPNCSLEYSCMPAAPPMPAVPHNISVFDPCYWTYCGGGTCTKTNNTYEHVCVCNSGYSNLNNVSVFPCFNECAIGSSDCAAMGIKLSSDSSTSTTPSGSTTDDSHAFSTLPGKSVWMAVFATSVVFFMWK